VVPSLRSQRYVTVPGPFIVIVPVKLNVAGHAPEYVTGLTLRIALVTMPGDGVAVNVGVGVLVWVGVAVGVAVGVNVGVLVAVLVGVAVGVSVGVGVAPINVRMRMLLL